MGLVASPTAIRRVGKKARKRLNAMACAIMLVRGNTLPNMLKARLERAADAIIARHYTFAIEFPHWISGCRHPKDVACPYPAGG
jgi:hypothetical protein